jgi:hypothetical protein
MALKAKNAAQLQQLAALADAPGEQTAFAIKLLESERNMQVIQAALQALSEYPPTEAREPLLHSYAHFSATSDSGAYVRAAILRALRSLARPADTELLTHAAMTYEFAPPGRSEIAAPLRSAALLALHEIDGDLAAYHCVRLLTDEYTSKMSGEPAVTAARVLAAQGQLLPLYAYCIDYHKFDERHQSSDALAECIRSLTGAPASIAHAIVEQYRDSQDEVALIGLFDLILERPDRERRLDVIRQFLRATRVYHAYHYLATLLATSRNNDLIEELLQSTQNERNPRKIQLLLDALALAPDTAEVRAVVERLQERMRA